MVYLVARNPGPILLKQINHRLTEPWALHGEIDRGAEMIL